MYYLNKTNAAQCHRRHDYMGPLQTIIIIITINGHEECKKMYLYIDSFEGRKEFQNVCLCRTEMCIDVMAMRMILINEHIC